MESRLIFQDPPRFVGGFFSRFVGGFFYIMSNEQSVNQWKKNDVKSVILIHEIIEKRLLLLAPFMTIAMNHECTMNGNKS